MSRKEVIEGYKKLEEKGIFDEHVDPIDYSLSLPVDNFNYVKKGFEKIKYDLEELFIVKPYTYYQNKFVVKTQVLGRNYLKGIKKAIITCNHVYMFDCLVAKHALKGHKLKITAADFNNRSDFLGEMMRAGGLLPISNKIENMRRFEDSLKYYLDHNTYVMFYPEQAMWYMYDKPRPFKNGAFHYATKFNVPIIPLFITYRNSGKFDSEGLEIKYFTIHILKPIYPNIELSKSDNLNYMKETDFNECKEVYELVYNKKLKYDIKE
jgi:1-acyl-sn-glycerol-3-phosphate acyltransferase